MAVTRLAWRPREHTRDPHVEDDRVQKEGALQPRLVPLRVHEGGVDGPVAVDVLEQDAVDVLHCGSTQKKRLFGPSDESAMLIIVLHTSSVLVTARAKKKKTALIQTGKSLWSFSGIRGSFAGSWLSLTGIGGRNKKRRLVIIYAPMVILHIRMTWEPWAVVCSQSPCMNKEMEGADATTRHALGE